MPAIFQSRLATFYAVPRRPYSRLLKAIQRYSRVSGKKLFIVRMSSRMAGQAGSSPSQAESSQVKLRQAVFRKKKIVYFLPRRSLSTFRSTATEDGAKAGCWGVGISLEFGGWDLDVPTFGLFRPIVTYSNLFTPPYRAWHKTFPPPNVLLLSTGLALETPKSFLNHTSFPAVIGGFASHYENDILESP